MLHLQARVELEEEEGVVLGYVQKLGGGSSYVPDCCGERSGGLLHRAARARGHSRGGRLLDHLLVAALHGAVSPVQRGHVAVAVAQQLHFDVAAHGRAAHEKHRAARHLSRHLREHRAGLLGALHAADAAPPAASAGLDHEGEAHRDGPRGRLVGAGDARRLVCFLGDLQAPTLLVGALDVRTRPREGGHARGLREDLGGHLVAEGGHRVRGRAQKGDPDGIQRTREFGIF